MREILFRGKRVDNGEWVYGSLISTGEYCCILQSEENVHPMDYPYLCPDLGTIDGQATPVIPETVGQYTGLKDKDGRKIFEGDVVDISEAEDYGMYGPATYDSPLVEVEWSNWACGFDPFANYDCDCGIHYSSNEVSVAGNIHDNPELLEVEE